MGDRGVGSEDGFRAYRSLLALVLRPETRMDRIDDYLVGKTGQLPAAESSQEDSSSEDEGEEKTLAELLEAVVTFPATSLGVLQGLLPSRPYSLLTLFALHGDRCLIYALSSLTPASLVDFDWRLFNALSPEAKLILKSIRADRRLRRPLRIPRDIQRRIQEIKQNRVAQQRQKRSRTDSPEPAGRNGQQATAKTGVWMGNYFVEDYEDQAADQDPSARPSGTTTNSNRSRSQAGPCSSNPPQNVKPRAVDHKRAKLASLAAAPRQRATTTPSPPPPPPPPPPPLPLPAGPQALPGGDTNSPFVCVQVSGLPLEASPESILFFFQHGADIFKVARKHEQRINALGRALHKFKPNVIHAYRAKGSSGKGGEVRRFEVKGADITMVETSGPGGAQAETRSVIVRFRRNSSSPLDDQQQTAWKAFIEEFNRKKYFPYDPLCPPLSCRLLPSS
ncbi:hypothetical protein PtB15_5B100 [Puccinia triticina]|nr:hypothetical protein PtB15_5B100 [Puccinia triticina]